jgi:beta-lactamase regulating signal transducer with metallopeptidase domain
MLQRKVAILIVVYVLWYLPVLCTLRTGNFVKFYVYFTVKQNISPLHSGTDVSLYKPVMLPYVYLPQGGG